MKLREIKLTNFRRFADFQIDFESQLTVLTARNGAGKSSVLDAIAIALGPFISRLPGVSGLSPKETDFRVFEDGKKPPYMRISCETRDGKCWDRTERRDQSKKTAQSIPTGRGLKEINEYADKFINSYNEGYDFQLPIFIYYGTGRGVFDIPQRKRGFGKDFSRFDAFEGSLESRNNFRRFVEYFYFLEELESKKQKEERSFDVQIPELKAIRMAIKKFMPDFKNPRGAYPAGIMVDWTVNGKLKHLKIEQLSDGYRTSLAMAMDIAARMAEANPDMDDPLKTEGIVLIDEVDLHLHPSWQQRILLDLMNTFENIQFIVSTHSPQVVSTVDPTSLRAIDWVDDKAQVIPVDFSKGAEAQRVLKDILGVDPRPESLDIVKKLHRYQCLVSEDKWDSIEAINLRKELDEWGAEHEPELARLDMDIRLKQLEREA